jgi:hypothetical protein
MSHVARALERAKDRGYRTEGSLMTSPKGYTIRYTCLPEGVDPRGPKGTRP